MVMRLAGGCHVGLPSIDAALIMARPLKAVGAIVITVDADGNVDVASTMSPAQTHEALHGACANLSVSFGGR